MEEQQTIQVTPPPSPGVGRFRLTDCIEELLKFTLTSSINGEAHLGLSTDYCSHLLQHDPTNPLPLPYDHSKGVPAYPLYKHLATSLQWSISRRALFPRLAQQQFASEDSPLKSEEDDWTKLIMEKGSELLNVLAMVDFELHVQEPYFSQLKDGYKIVEGRCAVGNYNRIAPGAFILFNKSLLMQVQDCNHYASFHEMLETEGLQRVLPGVKTLEEGVQVYRKFYPEERERLNGVLSIHVTKAISQLYSCMATLLLGLNYGGIQRMLNMGHTMGTVQERLPPPASALVSSFLTPQNLHVRGSLLTEGARALAKHVKRSSDKYWGNFLGNDSDKNMVAMDVISHLITDCCWLNIHTVPPHGVVFEVRVADGYGARWSGDGHKFIGFLEPYMVDGHLQRWMH